MKKPTSNNRSGFVLLGSILLVLFFSVLISATMMRSGVELRMVDQRNSALQAFYAAESGIERSLFELRRNPNWFPGEGGIEPVQDVAVSFEEEEETRTIGYYNVEVADGGILNGWNTRWVRSIGRDEFNQLTRVIVARVLIENPTRFLISTLGDLRIQSGASMQADVLARDFYFEVDPNLESPQSDILLGSDVLYLRSVNPENPGAIDQITITGDLVKSEPITFAGVDVDRYRDIAMELATREQGVYADGDLDIDLDNLDSLAGGPVVDFEPQIIFAEGNVTIVGEYDHSLLVVANGDIELSGNILPAEELVQRPQLGILSSRDVMIPDGAVAPDSDLDIEAFIMADGNGDSEGVFVAQGPKSVLGTLNFTGAISVRGGGRTAIDLNAFKIRQLNFNPELTENRRIPFSPFIANVISWREATLAEDFPPVE